MPFRWRSRRVLGCLADALWLVLLAAHAAAGAPLAPFHGDEGMLLYATHDFATVFLERNPRALVAEPPFAVDSDAHLRILNGSWQRYSGGLAWHLAGFTTDDLPPRPGWQWAVSPQDNALLGYLPNPHLLLTQRGASIVAFAWAVVVLFALARGLGGRPLAYAATALLALNPAVLVNVRRGTLEGTLLLFGLLAVWAGAALAATLAREGRAAWWRWALLALAGGSAVAAKHTGVAYTAAAWAWAGGGILFGALAHTATPVLLVRRLVRQAAQLAAAGVAALVVFVALSPALWSHPVARFADIYGTRAQLLAMQVASSPDAPMTLGARVRFALAQPYAVPAMVHEAHNWPGTIDDQIARYLASGTVGYPTGPWLGTTLMLLVGVGLAALWRTPGPVGRARAFGLTLWLLAGFALLLANPLPWQRYALPLLPPLALLSAYGLVGLARAVWRSRARLGAH